MKSTQQPRAALRIAVVAALILASTLAVPVVARAEDAIFAISGRGWGHGVGMSQFGALGYAQQGKTYSWIMSHYFQQTTLATRPELTVKVDLDKDKDARSSWRISAASSSATLTVSDYSSDVPSYEVTPGLSVWITFSGGNAVLRANSRDAEGTSVPGSIVATFTDSAIAATGSAKDSLVRIWGDSGPFDDSGIAWRGRIRFVPNTTTGRAINYVPMEQYLRGVVPRESPSSWHAEALKAQAVAARSYAYEAASAGDILWCTTMSQVYNGASDHTSSHEPASTDAAIAATANQFVVYGTKVITTYFSSSSGGRTANSKDVWFTSSTDNASPVYYTTVEDADNVGGNSNYRWSLPNISGTDLARKVRDADNGTTSDPDPLEYSAPSPATITNVTLAKGTSGFVRYVTLKWSNGASHTITGPKFKSILGMKSTAFTVTLTNPPPTVTRYQDSDSRPYWWRTWSTISNSSASGGSYHRSATRGSKVTIMFKGSSVTWIGAKSSRSGTADISLDGTRVATVDLYSSSTKYRTAIWTKSGLSSDTTHTLVITVLGRHRASSSGSYVYVDAFDIAGTMLAVPRPPAWKRYDQTSSKVAYSTGWHTSSVSGMYGGTHAYSRVTSSTATFTFSGTQVRWIGKRASDYGQAWVSVDASAPVLVDLYSSTTKYQQMLFESGTLAPGTHTLTVRVAGTRNPKSTYKWIDVDAFEALEPAK